MGERACEKNDWYFLVLVGMRGNFEGTRNRVIDGCSRGGGEGYISRMWVDCGFKNFLANFLPPRLLLFLTRYTVIQHTRQAPAYGLLVCFLSASASP